jgi:S-adenosylmethionine:diacylglycerol 3-amino-3-carboxypropyl transferase
MNHLFDFGISQEDPRSEQLALDLHPTDSILSVASGGEVPLSLASLVDDIRILAVDISESQVRLCRLKLLAALQIEFPLNGQFLGYAKMDGTLRKNLYHDRILPGLTPEDALYWSGNLSHIEQGIVGAGRFERYISKMRFASSLFIGKKNLYHLIHSGSLEEQKEYFLKHIATRKSLRSLFKIAFHPAIYKKRGLKEQALIHAGKTTGERFYGKFEDFCTSSPTSGNYFLQYFLTGSCITDESLPDFLQPANKSRLIKNLSGLELSAASWQDALRGKEKGYFNKLHLSNLGDWMSVEEFGDVLSLIDEQCDDNTRICCRYLQKNQFAEPRSRFNIDHEFSAQIEKVDRFPFYTIQAITLEP